MRPEPVRTIACLAMLTAAVDGACGSGERPASPPALKKPSWPLWTPIGILALCAAATGCAVAADQEPAAQVASTQAALTEPSAAQAAPATKEQVQAETRTQVIARLRESIAKLEALESKASEAPNTQDAIRQLRTQKQRLTQRIRDVERNVRAVVL